MESSEFFEPLLAHSSSQVRSLGTLETVLVFFLALLVIHYLNHYMNNKRVQTLLDAAYDRDSTTVDGNDFQGTEQEAQEDEGRSIVEALKRQGRRCPVLFGSQNGTAEAYSLRRSQYGRSTVSLTTMVVDAGVYDWTHMGQIGHDTILIFVLASFGEGESTDNAANM